MKNTERPPHPGNLVKLDWNILLVSLVVSAFAAIVCMQIIAKIGIIPNTSVIGAIIAMGVSRIPIAFFKKYRQPETQNLVQTSVSAASLSAANCAFMLLAVFFLMGRMDCIAPMAVGVAIAVVLSILVIGWIYDSAVFPASGAWPGGVATAAVIEAGDKGGKNSNRLLQGMGVGILGAIFNLPMAGIGIVFISNIFSISAMVVGLLLRGYSGTLFNYDLGATYIPHGIMIGGGFVALVQCVLSLRKKKEQKEAQEEHVLTVSNEDAKKGILKGIVLYFAGVAVLALISGLMGQMSTGMFIGWIFYTGITSIITLILVGLAAMHAGWIPAFAITMLFLTIGIFIGFPPLALAFMAGFLGSIGPCFADMGYDLKTGWMIRGRGSDKALELAGRRQQVLIEIVGGVLGIVVALLAMNLFFGQELVPPTSKVIAATIEAGQDPTLLKTLLLWAIPGAIIQIAGGSKMLGIMLGTGLLINNPIMGVGMAIAVVVRIITRKSDFMHVRDAGLIAGDGLYGFLSAIWRTFMG